MGLLTQPAVDRAGILAEFQLRKKAYSRKELLRKVAKFTESIEDNREIYILYIRSILEQSCVLFKKLPKDKF